MMKLKTNMFRLLLIVAVLAMFSACANPGFSARFIRKAFDKEGARVNTALTKYVTSDVSFVLNVHYDTTDKAAFLDVYYPSSVVGSEKTLPTIVWIHGGAWIAGDKDQIANYAKIVAARGYTVAVVNYSLAPKKKYPTPVRQVNTALAYLANNAAGFHVDASQFVLAGDSGGAHIAAQLANIITEPSYSQLLGISPSLKPSQLAGLLLYCGPYDTEKVNLNGYFGKFLQIVLWSYSGHKDFTKDASFQTAAIVNYVTKDFPPTFISVGNGDPLASHSYKLAKVLGEKGVKVDSLFFAANDLPSLPHEYQFNMDTDAGKLALERSVQFLQSLTK